MSKKPVVSLIIPTYNCAGFLDETMGSVLDQLPEDCELVVVDDGSTDETPELLREYEKTYDKLKISLQPHGGVSAARNAGLDLAEGEWIAFMDCDDMLKADFFENAMPLPDDETDLYIFSFERVELLGAEELVSPLMVCDRVFDTVSDFADAYVRSRHLLIYSACNKFFRKSILDENGIRFRNGMSFGEDRLFNYDYLVHCGRVRTSSVRMFRYIQRNPESASKRSFPDYYDTIIMLHNAKMECFLKLSKGTTQSEKRAFKGYDISNEVSRMIDRFDEHPNEKEENLPKINRLLFGESDDIGGRYDILIVLGSSNCGYRAEKAYETAGGDPQTVFVVSGGNMHAEYEMTEAAYMAEILKKIGISEERIIVEDKADNTFRNLELSAEAIEDAVRSGFISAPADDLRIGIVTAGFHIPRTRLMAAEIEWYNNKNLVFIPAYSDRIRPDNWYRNPKGLNIGLSEISKACALCLPDMQKTAFDAER
jgi:glycosyltransferase involved in cell wall biosynthesis